MDFVKHIILFTKNNGKQLQRKWLSLPLLLLFPIIIISLIVAIIITFFSPADQESIQVGLVDFDQSEETRLVVDLIEDSSQLGSYIQIHSMTSSEAKEDMEANQLSGYITFPEHFTENLYKGTPVTLHVVGNPNQPTESQVVKELIDSVTRHISASQANILTINYYAKKLSMDAQARNDMLFEEFKTFFFYAIGKDKILDEEEISNQATTSPIHYYGIASWLIIITIWLLSIYNFLMREETLRMKQRMRLYGVTQLQQIIARMLVTLIVTSVFAVLSFMMLKNLLKLDLFPEDYVRIANISFLYSSLFLLLLAITESLIPSQKLRLLGQSVITGILLFASGSVIPTIYFPLDIQELVAYFFSNQAFHWLQEIILNDRLYADYIPLLLMNAAGFFILIGLSFWKERVME